MLDTHPSSSTVRCSPLCQGGAGTSVAGALDTGASMCGPGFAHCSIDTPALDSAGGRTRGSHTTILWLKETSIRCGVFWTFTCGCYHMSTNAQRLSGKAPARLNLLASQRCTRKPAPSLAPTCPAMGLAGAATLLSPVRMEPRRTHSSGSTSQARW